MRIIIIGIGGIGSHLLLPLLQLINSDTFDARSASVILVDGDHYEEKNKARQIVTGIGQNKATATSEYYESQGFITDAIPEYLTPVNIQTIIREDDIIFLCVDNNATRKLVDDHIRRLHNVTLISGGNELTDGNVQIVIREDDKYITPSLVSAHHEIDHPDDKNPDDLSCDELQHTSQPQIGIVNAGIADVMRRMFFGLITNGIDYNETYVNFSNGNIRNVKNYDEKNCI